MSHHGLERCPTCGPSECLAECTNGFGMAYLECRACGYYEPVMRKADPFPTSFKIEVAADGRTRKRPSRQKYTKTERARLVVQFSRLVDQAKAG